MNSQKGKVSYLGEHTAMGHLAGRGKAREVRFLKDNDGRLPPFILAFGSRVRVAQAIKVLGLKYVTPLHDESAKLLGDDYKGRVDLVLGIYFKDSKPLPLLLVETQMGCSANQIILREVLANTRTDGYKMDLPFLLQDSRNPCCLPLAVEDKGVLSLSTSGIWLVRAGTAGGINLVGSVVKLEVGDIVVATETMGHIGALFQSLGIMDISDPELSIKYMDTMLRLGFAFKDNYHIAPLSKELALALREAALAMKLIPYVGGNLSKDSLYAEADEAAFVAFRQKYGVFSTEMEQTIIEYEAARMRQLGIPVQTGLISAIVGLVPGGSFASDPAEAERAKKAETNVIITAADALHRIAYPQFFSSF